MVESIFLNKEYSTSYPLNRKMNSHSFENYFEKVKVNLNGKTKLNILDIGCGTGQFTTLLAEYFYHNNYEVSIVGVDKSSEMLRVAKEVCSNKNLDNINFINCDVLEYKSAIKYDLIFSSEMIHLIDDSHMLFNSINQLLSDNGIIAIRTSTHQQLYNRAWYKFFPSLLPIDISRHKSSYLIRSSLENLGYTVKQYEMDETEEMNTQEYIKIFENKSYSTLRLIPSHVFERNLKKLKEELVNTTIVVKDYKMTLYIAEKIK